MDRETEGAARDLARYALMNEFKRRPFRREEIQKSGKSQGYTR